MFFIPGAASLSVLVLLVPDGPGAVSAGNVVMRSERRDLGVGMGMLACRTFLLQSSLVSIQLMVLGWLKSVETIHDVLYLP